MPTSTPASASDAPAALARGVAGGRDDAAPAPRGRPGGPGLWSRYRRNRGAVAGLLVVLVLIAAAVGADQLTPHDPTSLVGPALQPPGGAHLLGTDSLGRDVLSGVLHGARVSLAVGLLAAAASAVIGVLVGALSGFAGGPVDAVLMRITELFQVLPRFFLALLVVALAGPGIERIIVVIGVLSWPAMARLVRAEFLSLREREFVDAARALGVSPAAIVARRILPNALPPVIVAASVDVAQAILLEAGLSFFGLGDPDHVSWGTMLNNALAYLRSAWWMSVSPGLAIFFCVLGLNLVGDGLNDALNPRLRTR
jgi:peptide/nickel transport system permease protein